MHNVSSSYFDAASLLTVALLAASFLHLLACLGAWTSRRGLAWRAWSSLPSSLMHVQLVSSGNQFSKIGHIQTYSALACFMLMPVSNIKTVLSLQSQ